MNETRLVPDKILDALDLEVIAEALDMDYTDEYIVMKRNIHVTLKKCNDPVTKLFNYHIDHGREANSAIMAMHLMGCKVKSSWDSDELSKTFRYLYIIYRIVCKSRDKELDKPEPDFIIPDAECLLWSLTNHRDEEITDLFTTNWFNMILRPNVIAYVFNEIKRLLLHGIPEPIRLINLLYQRVIERSMVSSVDALVVALASNDAFTKLMLSLYDGTEDLVGKSVGLIPPHDMTMKEYIESSMDDLEFLCNDSVYMPNIPGSFEFNQPYDVIVPDVKIKPITNTKIITLYGPFFIDVTFPKSRFHFMSDKEISEEFGVLIPHLSREDLIKKYESYEKGDMHFYRYINTSRFVGMESPISYEIITENDYVYGVGHHYYLLQDLVESVYDDNGIVRINIPPLPARPSISLAIELTAIMEANEELETVSLLERFIKQSEDPLSIDKSLVTPELHESFREFLVNIIYMGLYARRWRGDGKPIPYSKEATDTKTRLHELRIQKLIAKNSEFLSKENGAVTKYMYPYNFSDTRSHGTFMPMYHEMCSGNKCIREMAEMLIGTGYHYLKNVYDEIITINGEPLELRRFEFMNPIAPEERE